MSLAVGSNGSALVQPFIVWERPFSATSVSVAPNAVYAAGGNEVRRYDLNGTLVWTADVDSWVTGLAADPRGVYVVGSAPDSNYNGVGFEQRNATLARLNSTGSIVWSRELTTSPESITTSWASAVAVDSTGIYVAGYTLLFYRYPQYGWVAKTDSNGNQSWVERLDPIAITTAISSGPRAVYLSGFSRGCLGSTSSDVCPVQAYLTAIDPNGQTLWTHEIPSYCGPTSHSSSCDYQGAPQTFAHSISAGVSGVYVSGSTEGVIPGQVPTSSGRGASDAFVGRYDQNGTELWIKQFGTAYQNRAYGISTGPKGTYVVVSDGLRQFDSDGNQLWLLRLDFAATSISASPAGVFLGGWSSIAEACATPSCAHLQ
ncbi:MAG TPA: hypothetical protein VEL52_03045 [Candidatus Bathyarchaeia archaeon]|nr:hypothetical protein [Candidatus Bathyarchaeia archaeon]